MQCHPLPRRLVLGGTLALAATGPLQAQVAARRPIRLVVPFAAGGPNDLVARLVAETWTGLLGQPVLVDNRAGAGGNIGAEAVARAEPDGRTLLWAQGATHGANPSLYRRLGYDAVADFAPVGLVSTAPLVLVGRPDLGPQDLAGLLRLARSGQLRVGTGGIGTTPHMAAALLAHRAELEWTTVPYRGNAPALADLLAGQLDLLFEVIPVALPLLRDGRLQSFGITSASPSELLPGVAPLADTLPGFEATSWAGIVAPAATRAEALARLSNTLIALGGVEPLRRRLAEAGVTLGVQGPEAMRSFVVTEIGRWRELVQATGMTAE